MARVKNTGTDVAYVPTDTGTLALDGGATSPELRFGDADYAVRNVATIEWSDEEVTAAGVSKASTESGVLPIGAFEEDNPDVLRYAVTGDTVGDPSEVTVTPVADGGIVGVATGTVAPPAGASPVVIDDTTGTDQDAAKLEGSGDDVTEKTRAKAAKS